MLTHRCPGLETADAQSTTLATPARAILRVLETRTETARPVDMADPTALE